MVVLEMTVVLFKGAGRPREKTDEQETDDAGVQLANDIVPDSLFGVDQQPVYKAAHQPARQGYQQGIQDIGDAKGDPVQFRKMGKILDVGADQ